MKQCTPMGCSCPEPFSPMGHPHSSGLLQMFGHTHFPLKKKKKRERTVGKRVVLLHQLGHKTTIGNPIESSDNAKPHIQTAPRTQPSPPQRLQGCSPCFINRVLGENRRKKNLFQDYPVSLQDWLQQKQKWLPSFGFSLSNTGGGTV